MIRELRFRIVLPIVESGIAALFGGIGLWQRSAVLNHRFFEGQTMWDTTARFHVWPWPYKFAAVSNLPALFGGLLLTIPIGERWPTLPESLHIGPTLLFVWFLWYWVGSRLDRRWSVKDRIPCIALIIFTLICLVGAIVPLDFTGFLYTGYQPYGITVWVFAIAGLLRHTFKYRGTSSTGLKGSVLHR